jgi:DNA modification methylase
MSVDVTTKGWRRTCTHDSKPVACTVLDPFAGAFTTTLVAARLDRNSIGVDLNPNYIKMSRERLAKDNGC